MQKTVSRAAALALTLVLAVCIALHGGIGGTKSRTFILRDFSTKGQEHC